MEELDLLAAQTLSVENEIFSENVIISSIQLMEFYVKQKDYHKAIEYGEKALKAIHVLYNTNKHPSYIHINIVLIRCYVKINRFFKSKEIADSLKPYQIQHQDMDVLYAINEATTKLDCLKADANNGDAEAQHILAANFGLYGNIDEALKWYQKSADGGYLQSKHILLLTALHYHDDDDKILALYQDIKKSSLPYSMDKLVAVLTALENISTEVGKYFSLKALDAATGLQYKEALRLYELGSQCGFYKASYCAGILAKQLILPTETVRQYFYAGLNNILQFSHNYNDNEKIEIRAKIHHCLANLDLTDPNRTDHMITRGIYNLAISKALGSEKATNILNLLISANPDLTDFIYNLIIISPLSSNLFLPQHLMEQCKLTNLRKDEFTQGFNAFLSGVPGIFDAPENRVETDIVSLMERAFATFNEDGITTSSSRVTNSWDATRRAPASAVHSPPTSSPEDLSLSKKNRLD